MPTCETCGNDYDKTFEVVLAGQKHVFDSFECAIQALALRCKHCGVPVVGHGLEAQGEIFCCEHCAATHGVKGLKDRMQ